ncbi:MAG: membrane protein insertase YidC [Candidatus Omnitrophota bacterium]
MEKKMILAVGLSLLILFGFQVINPKPTRKQTLPTPSQQTTYDVSSPREGGETIKKGLPSKQADQTVEREETAARLSTEKIDLVFSDIGGSLKEIHIVAENDPQGEKELLYLQEDPTKRTFALRSELLSGLDIAKYDARKGRDFVEYTYVEKDWLKITKRFSLVSNNNVIEVEVKIENLSSGKRDISYTIVGPGAIQLKDSVSGRNFLEVNTLIDGKIWKVTKTKEPQARKGPAIWTALKSRYYGLIMRPGVDAREVVVRGEGQANLLTELNFGGWALSPGAEVKQESIFYAGPLNEKEISSVSQDMAAVVNYGFFGGVSKVLLVILKFYHSLVRNWGISIILLTLTVNICLFPLAVKSFASMHQMKKIQPHIMKLKELHKDNPQKLNKETMELYKKNNVNPLGGCLPLLLQMPIFIALYQGLIRSIELKGASFLWIKDLARPDAVPIPVTLPLIGNSINILPLLMVVTMALQQKMTQASTAKDMTEEQKNQQKMMMLMMPVIFGFMFYNMPSGLVLYWLTNTILMTTGQKIISRRLEA